MRRWDGYISMIANEMHYLLGHVCVYRASRVRNPNTNETDTDSNSSRRVAEFETLELNGDDDDDDDNNEQDGRNGIACHL